MESVNHPSHYQSENMEVIEVIDEFFWNDFSLGNVFKYIARAGRKGDRLEDLEKARWYLDHAIQHQKRTGGF